MIDEQKKNVVFAVVFSAVIVLLLGGYILICCQYPYYFIWDMDHITCLDTVLIQSELLPDQIGHPSFGMYLLLFCTEKIAHLSGVVSILDLEGLSASLNPLAAMAELTDFVRLNSPFLSVGIAFLLCMAMHVIFGMSRWYLVFFLVFLGVQESLAYHSSMVRSELYSVFYWCGAVLMTAVAAKATGTAKRYVSLLVVGILLGLCLLTKVQSLFYLAVVPVLFMLAFYIFQDERTRRHADITRRGSFWVLALSLFNAAAFLILGIASYSTPIPRGVPTWAAAFRITPVATLFFLVLLLLFLCQFYLCVTNKVSSDAFRLFSFFSVMGTGFILSFAFYFFLYSDATLSLQYMLLNFKIVFLRVFPQSSLGIAEPSVYVSNLLLYVCYNPMPFIVHVVLILLLVFGCLRRFVRITKGQLTLCLVVTVLAFVNVVVMTRYKLKDIIWEEMLLNFLNLFYFAVLVSRASRYRLALARVGGGLLMMLFLANCVHVYNTPDRIDANYNQYGWNANKFLGSVYGRNHRKYSAIMREKYNNTTAEVARTKAIDHRRIRRTVDFVFKNQAITHRNIGIVFEGFSAWSADLGYKITKVPPPLKGAILVDNASVGLKSRTFFKEEYVRERSQYMDKFKKSSSAAQISVLTRPDLKVFLFVDAGDIFGLVTEEIVETPYKIVLQDAKQSIGLQGLEIKNYSEIDVDKLSEKFFFVIRRL
ncbi:MAG: hypothetical protein ACYS18_07185 [Planctomycetota bacterium]